MEIRSKGCHKLPHGLALGSNEAAHPQPGLARELLDVVARSSGWKSSNLSQQGVEGEAHRWRGRCRRKYGGFDIDMGILGVIGPGEVGRSAGFGHGGGAVGRPQGLVGLAAAP